jgi:hypothetical protein
MLLKSDTPLLSAAPPASIIIADTAFTSWPGLARENGLQIA